MVLLTKECLQIDIANAIARHHREQQGKAPERIRVTICGCNIYVLSSDVFTVNEEELHNTAEGRKLIKSARLELRALTRESAHAAISRVVGCPVIRSFWDIDVRVGEQLEAYVMSENIELKLDPI